MALKWILLISRQGKVRLAKWYGTLSQKSKNKIVKDVTQLVLARRSRMCNFIEYKDAKVVYRRYASLFFVAGVAQDDNELITLEIIHRYVEVLDRYFGNVCELDLIFNFQKAYTILDELVVAGELQESSKKSVLRVVTQGDGVEEAENSEDVRVLCVLTSRSRESGVDLARCTLVDGLDHALGEAVVHDRAVARHECEQHARHVGRQRRKDVADHARTQCLVNVEREHGCAGTAVARDTTHERPASSAEAAAVAAVRLAARHFKHLELAPPCAELQVDKRLEECTPLRWVLGAQRGHARVRRVVLRAQRTARERRRRVRSAHVIC